MFTCFNSRISGQVLIKNGNIVPYILIFLYIYLINTNFHLGLNECLHNVVS
jgi:hypothetical protein